MPSALTIEELVEVYLVRRFGSDSTREKRAATARLLPVLELVGMQRQVAQVRAVDFERAHIDLKAVTRPKPYSRFTLNAYFRAVRAMLNWCTRQDLIERSPFTGFHFDPLPQPNPKAVTQNTFEALVQAAGDERHQMYYWMTLRDAAMVCVLRDAGCPATGIVGATLADVGLRRRRIRIIEAASWRAPWEHRYVDLGPRAMERLKLWINARSEVALPEAGDALFIRQERNGGISATALYYLLDRLTERAKLPKVRNLGTLPAGQFAAILRAAVDGRRYDHKWEAVRDVALLYMLRDTGARVGGLVGATVDDLDLPRRRLMVHEKGGKYRNVYLTPATVERVRTWLDIRAAVALPSAGGALFIRMDCKRGISANGVGQLLRRIARQADVGSSRCNPHSFRHAFARDLLSSGVDLSRVSRLMGHSGIEVTNDYYARWADHELQATHASHSPLAEAAYKSRAK